MKVEFFLSKSNFSLKISKFFDSRYFLDLDHIFKLIGRYKKMVFITSGLVLGYFTYLFAYQPNVYLKVSKFRFREVETEKTSDLGNAFMKGLSPIELSEENSDLDRLKALIYSWEFKDAFIKRVLNNEINFDFKIGRGEILTLSEIRDDCQMEQECFIKDLSDVLVSMYNVKKNIGSDDYSLIVSGSHRKTVEFLNGIIKEEILAVLKKDEIDYLDLKINMVKEMINDKEVIVQENDLEELTSRMASLESKHFDIKQRIADLQLIYNKELAKKNEYDLQIKYLTDEVYGKNSSKQRLKYENVNRLERMISQYQENILLLKQNNDRVTNKKTIRLLQAEIRKIQKQIKSYGKISRETSSYETYHKSKSEVLPDLKVKLDVVKETLQRTEEEITTLQLEREQVLKEENEIKHKIKLVEPIKIAIVELQKRLEFFEFQRNTVIPNVAFYKEVPFIEKLKSHSLKKTVFLALVCLFLVILSGLVIRYLFDDKIYRYDDYVALHGDLEPLGDVVLMEESRFPKKKI